MALPACSGAPGCIRSRVTYSNSLTDASGLHCMVSYFVITVLFLQFLPLVG